ncbi:WD40 repeat-like protein [Cylindrobasidium torrendii FP15055 ss-10]|uniref:WD40 repeat-like protein n=1 Tax=Cylindrobasidium torrendii FP15055 ss-10 TaxID=1314674 RepID=A0A0D7B4R1_9AGAR|nr:WD40 repeat-like protein [Cylindrobasidium torrendii FP15055 ss-10]
MAKGNKNDSRKRQKISSEAVQEKDDEERRLESLLFGVPYEPEGAEHVINLEDDAEDAENDEGGEMAAMNDSDLFFLDDGVPATAQASLEDAQEADEAEAIAPVPTPVPTASTQRSAWEDPADAPAVSLEANLLRKLRDAPSESTVSGHEYERRLRRQFERINPAPSWAKKRRRAEEEDDMDGLLASTSGIIRGSRKSATLQPGTLNIERQRDANQSAQKSGCGAVQSLSFHPSDRVPVLAVATTDRRVRLYNVDGHTSPLLQTLHVPSLPFDSHSLSFHPSGSQLLLTSAARPSYVVYDLQTSQTTTHSSTRFCTDRQKPDNLALTAFSPTGDILASAGRNGNIQLIDWASGGGHAIGTMKCPGTAGGGIKSLVWTSDQTLMALTGDAEVFLWDVAERRCVRRWQDEGGFRGTGRAMVGSQSWMAIGGNTGIVNVYGQDAFQADQDATPKPKKAVGNLTTAVSGMSFNHDGQLLAVASKEKKDGMKMIHLPSLTVYGNWPTSSTPLGHVSSMGFSARSEYLAVGNTKGRVLLYHLKDYGARGGVL